MGYLDNPYLLEETKKKYDLLEAEKAKTEASAPAEKPSFWERVKPFFTKTEESAPPVGMGELRAAEATVPIKPPKPGIAERFYRAFTIPSEALIKATTFGLGGAGGPIERGISKLFGVEPPPPLKPETTGEKIASTVGELAGSVVPISRLYGMGAKAAGRLIPEAATLPAKITKTFLPGALAGAAYEGIKATAEGKPLPEVGKEAAIGAAFFGGGDVALRGLAVTAPKVVSYLRRVASEGTRPLGEMWAPPKVEVPKAEAPKVEVPEVELPKAEETKVEVKPTEVAVPRPPAVKTKGVAQGKKRPTRVTRVEDTWRLPREEAADIIDPHWRVAARLSEMLGNPPTVPWSFKMHKEIVAKALREGKPVPPEVLKDYPDLAAKVEAKPETLPPLVETPRPPEYQPEPPAGLKLPEEKTLADKIRELPKKEATEPQKAGFYAPGTIGAAKLTVPEKMQPIGEGQKVRSFPVSAIRSPKTTEEVKAGVLADIYEGGPGAYTPVKLKAVEEEAAKIVESDLNAALRMVEKDETASALHTAVGIKLVERFQNEGNFDKAIDVVNALAEKLTRQGQSIAAARLINWATPEGAIIAAQRQVKKAIEKAVKDGKITKEQAKLITKADEEARKLAEKVGLPVLTKDTAETIKKLTDVLQNAKDENAKWEAMVELKGLLQSLKPANVLRKISVAQVIAQLLNPKTQIRNIFGNELFFRLERLNKYVATPIDWARSTLTGKPRTVTFSTGGQGGYWEGFLKGWKAGWKGVSPHGLGTQFDLGPGLAFNPKGNPAEKVASFLERALWATMRGFDYAAYNRAYKQTLGEMAVLRAMNEGKKATKELIEQYMKEADANLVSIADQYGKYVTFQDDNVISGRLSDLKRWLNKLTGSTEFGLGDLLIKYPRTPGALIARGLEYSLAGFIRAAYQLISMLKKGKMDERELLLNVSRAITGTAGLTGTGYFLYDVGIITGPAEDDPDVRAMQRELGTHPYRVNVTALKRWLLSGFNPDAAKLQEGDMLISYDWAQPVAMAIAMGASIAKQAADAQRKSKFDYVTKALGAAGGSVAAAVQTVAEQPVLSGLVQFFTRYGNEPVGSSAVRRLISVAAGAPSSFVPTLSSQLRALADNRARVTYAPNENPIIEAWNKVKYKIPGLAETLPPAYTPLGQPKEVYPGGGNTLFNVMFNPAFVSRYAPTREQQLPLEVWRETGETKQFPREVKRYFEIAGQRFDLTPEEYSLYQRVVGESTRKGFSQIPQGMPPQQKLYWMLKVLNQANEIGKATILERRGYRLIRQGSKYYVVPKR